MAIAPKTIERNVSSVEAGQPLSASSIAFRDELLAVPPRDQTEYISQGEHDTALAGRSASPGVRKLVPHDPDEYLARAAQLRYRNVRETQFQAGPSGNVGGDDEFRLAVYKGRRCTNTDRATSVVV